MRNHIILTTKQLVHLLWTNNHIITAVRMQGNARQEYSIMRRGKYIVSIPTEAKAKPRSHSIESFVNKFPQDAGTWVFNAPQTYSVM